MFDIDGTLTETMKIDEECFVRSLVDLFGFTDIDTDWSHYPHATDSGLFHDIYTTRIGQPPTALDVSRFRQHFVHLLAAAADARACRALGILFIGIGSGVRAARLASEGAVRVFQDFSDADLFLESLDEITHAV
jgi:hypothetical protein